MTSPEKKNAPQAQGKRGDQSPTSTTMSTEIVPEHGANLAHLGDEAAAATVPVVRFLGGTKDVVGKESAPTWADLCRALAEPKEYPDRNALPLIKFGVQPWGSRAKGTIPTSLSAAVGDYDAGEVSVAEAVRRLRKAGIVAAVYTTRRHTPERPRWRVVAPLSAPVGPDGYGELLDLLNGALGGILAPESWEATRCYFYGRVKGAEYVFDQVVGAVFLDVHALLGVSWRPIGKTDGTSKATKPTASVNAGHAADDFFSRVNSAAMAAFDAWVPQLLPQARKYQGGYRVTSADLGRDLEEDLSIVPEGIKDFGVADMGDPREGKRSPIDLVREWAPKMLDIDDMSILEAAAWLCERLGVTKESLGYGRTFDDIMATIKEAQIQPGGEAQFATEVLTRAAKANLSPIHEELVIKGLKTATGVRLAAMRATLKRIKEGDEAGESYGWTHFDYAVQLLGALAAETGGKPPVGTEGAIYTVGADAVWRGRQANEFEVDVAERFSGREKCERRSDYSGIAMHAYAIAARGNADFFAGAPIGMACPDGVFYRVETDGALVTEVLTAEHRQRFIVATTPREMPTPLFDRFLAQTFATDTPDECKAQTALLQEVMGAAALGLMARHEKVVLLYGPGRSGKGTALKILEALVPKEWRTAVTPFRWNSEYYLANLAGKRLNVVGELPEDMPIPAAEFKTVTGRDLLAGRDPGGRPFTFRNEAAHIFNSNYLISTRDHSDAFFTRWIVIAFMNSRMGAGDAAIEIDLADRIVKEELPGVLWWALQGACRLTARGRFQTTRSHGETLAKWRRRTDSLLEFLHDAERCRLEPGGEPVKRTVVYSQYVSWCVESGRKPMGKHKLFDALESPQAKALGLRVRRHEKLREVVDGLVFVGAAADELD